jgi:hypothetical protein
LFAALPNVFIILISPFLLDIADVICDVEMQYLRAKPIKSGFKKV